MTNILLLLAVLGMLVGVYAVAMPTLTRKGWRLPFAGFFSEADDAVDEEFEPAFEMPRASDIPAVVAPSIAPIEVPEPLPPVVTIDINEEEDDPTLTPLFEGLEEEVAAATTAETPVAAAPEAQAPHLMLVPSQPADAVQAAEAATPDPVAEAPAADPLAPEGNDMLSLFSEASDAGKGPNLILEAAGDVTITDLMDEVRKLREILDKRAA